MKTPVILRIFKNNQLVEVKQFDLDQIVIGHDADVQLDLDHDSVSPIHCLIEKRAQGFYVCDLGSKSGTFKNGQAILDEPLTSGEEIVVGPFKISFFVGAPKVAAQSVAASAPPTARIPEKKEIPMAAEPKVKLTPIVSKPEIKNKETSKSIGRKRKTFAPPNQIQDLKSFFRPSKGNNVEVLVAWKGRVIDSFHFKKAGFIRSTDLNLPMGALMSTQPIIEIKNGVKIFVTSDMDCEIVTPSKKINLDQAVSENKASRGASGYIVKLEQSEIIYLTFDRGNLQLIIRHVPMTSVIPLMPPLLMSSEEITGLALSLVLVGLLAFTISATTPPDADKKVDEITRVAQVVFNNPPEKKSPPQEKPEIPPPPAPPEKIPPPEKVKAKAEDKKVETQKKGAAVNKKTQSNQVAGRANEVAPIPNSQNKPKKFTSVKQGGAVKLGQKAGANAQSSTKDVTKMGLFSAFGGGGIRKKVDAAYSGAGELLGQADKATGTSGMGENRAGDDLGSKFKDTGAGGKGTATQGIAGIGTKGRSNGTSAYGSSDGFGDKTSVNIEPGGAEEDFVGTIDKEAVRRAVLHNLNQVRGCFVRELNKLDVAGRGKLEGKVILTWDITARGIPKNVRVKNSTLNNVTVENCIRDRLASWSFPEPPVGMTAEVSYPFYLRPGN